MKMKSLLLGAMMFGALISGAQENAATATLIGSQNWFPPATVFTPGTLGITGSGVGVCSGIDDDDVWFRFNTTTQAAKIHVVNPDFDAVIELYDNSLTLISCENTNTGNISEIMKVNGLIMGTQHYVRVHSFDGIGGTGAFQFAVEYYPLAEVRNGWYPVYLPDDAIPGYKVNQTVNRTVYSAVNNALVEGTRWLFIDTATNEQCTADITGVSAQINLNLPGCICYDKFYNVYVQVKVDNFWCGYSNVRMIDMENYPTTSLEPAYAGQHYDIDEDLKAVFVGDDQLLEWELVTDNGQTVLNYTNTSSFLYFQEVPCIRYNKIYNVRIRCSYCGGPFGPWSNYSYVITNELPYTNVKSWYCNTWQWSGATLLCDFINVADQYAWQFAPIEEGDPTMTPIGPATVVYSSFTDLFLLPIGLEYGQTYRVGVKPFVGYSDSCDDIQEGDYGYFCPVSIIDPANPPAVGPSENYPLVEDHTIELSEKNSMSISSFISGNKVLSVKLENQVTGNGVLKIYNASGSLVFENRYYKLEDASYLQVNLDQFVPGLYIITIESEGEIQADKIYFR